MATLPDIRFDCRYCNKPVTVAAKYAGQRVKCPACKNPVVVPGVEGAVALAYEDASTGEQLNRVDDRAVRNRGGFSLRPLIKLVVLVGLGYGGWKGYGWWQGQSKKPLGVLLAEMTDGTLANEAVIANKISEEVEGGKKLSDEKVSVLGEHKKSSNERTRKLVATSLGKSANPKAIALLKPMIMDDKSADVRREAAESVGEVGWVAQDKALIEWIIERMAKESDQTVIGGLHAALRVMTANTDQNKPTAQAWKHWWSTAEKSFKFGSKGTR